MENRTLSNGEVYRKTLTFSIRRLGFNTLMVIILAALSSGGFILTDRWVGQGLYGLGVGVIIGIVLIAILAHFFSYVLKAGQIAVMTKAVTENQLPDDVYGEGKRIVKERFTTVAVYYAATGIIKGLFNELGHAITKVGEAIGGDSGGAVGGAISAVINTIIAYLCDCCLGWVFFRKEIGSFKATCEGAVIFFKHGKTFLKNMGRVFGIGLASFIAIGGAFFGIFYFVATRFSRPIAALSREISQLNSSGEEKKWIEILSNPTYLTIGIAALLAIIFWSIIHSTFVKPFVLVGVLRNYMASGMEDIPDESSFSILEKHSKKFKKYKEKNSME